MAKKQPAKSLPRKPKHKESAAWQHMYSSARWRRARAAFLAAHPLCVRCRDEGRTTPANVVDHIVSHRGDNDLFWDRSNLQSLCETCHNAKTFSEDRLAKRGGGQNATRPTPPKASLPPQGGESSSPPPHPSGPVSEKQVEKSVTDPEISVPPCPVDTDRAVEFWDWLIRELHRIKRYSQTDLPALERMVIVYECLCDAEQDVLKNGRTITIHARTGDYQQTSPSVAQMKTFGDQIRGWFNEFGLTPKGRKAISNNTGASELESFNNELRS